VTPEKWSTLSQLGAHFAANGVRYLAQLLFWLVLFAAALTALGHNARDFVPSFVFLYGACRHFRNDPAYLEAAIPGLECLSSGAASVRGDDGLCLRHDRYLGAGRSCADFASSLEAT